MTPEGTSHQSMDAAGADHRGTVATAISTHSPNGTPPAHGLRAWLRGRILDARRRSARFTTEGTRFVFFTLAVGVAAINTGNNLFYLLVAMMLSLIMLSGLLSELCLRHLQLSAHAPEWIYAGDEALLTVAITNGRPRFPSFSLRLSEVVQGIASPRTVSVTSLAPGATVLTSIPLHQTTRGRHQIEGIQVATPFPFGLFVKRLFIPAPLTILVLPKPQPLSDAILDEAIGHGADRTSTQRGPGLDLYNLRLYQPGDDSRLIHWMSTARTSQLIVRETQADRQSRVTLVLVPMAPPSDHHNGPTHDTVGDESTAAFERAVTLTASLVAAHLARQYQVSLHVGADQVLSRRGADDLPRLLTPLALCHAHPATPLSLEEARRQIDHHRAEADGSLVGILAWPSPMLLEALRHASRIFSTADDQPRAVASAGVPHVPGPRIPA